jgi:phage gp36-like protein
MSTYATASDIYDIFGEANVKAWANMEELSTAHVDYEDTVTARITKALEYATNDIDELLRGGPYSIPFTGDAITKTIVRCCALKAGAWLYEWRRDDEEADSRYSRMEARADKLIEQIRKDVRRLKESDQVITGTRMPGVVS